MEDLLETYMTAVQWDVCHIQGAWLNPKLCNQNTFHMGETSSPFGRTDLNHSIGPCEASALAAYVKLTLGKLSKKCF